MKQNWNDLTESQKEVILDHYEIRRTDPRSMKWPKHCFYAPLEYEKESFHNFIVF